MKRLVLPLLVVLALALAVGAAWLMLDRGHIGGRSAVTTETRSVPAFTRIRIDGTADVTLVQGPTPSVSVEAAGTSLRSIETDVRDGTLTIRGAPQRRWWSFLRSGAARTPRIAVTFRTLEAIEAAGSVTVRSDDLKVERLAIAASGTATLRFTGLEVRSFSIDGSGAVKAEITGRATEQSISVSGACDYRAAGLASEKARIAVSGAGRVVVNATKTLDVEISGAGTVDYLGNPEVTKKVSGAGRVKRREAAQEHDGALA